ncbi:ycf3-interacting protein 1, chloroplastic [Silene latifolia]|uniref:ycf3-interacting protein 1, chloroplastic n=1 Tax=Silene latifolia TaxID=37657 RepID=UPI003D77FC16
MSTQALQLAVASSPLLPSHHSKTLILFNCNSALSISPNHHHHHRRHLRLRRIHVGIADTEPPFSGDINSVTATTTTAAEEDDEEEEDDVDPTPEDLEYISQIQRVLELLKKNRDMLYGEVKLTISIEDPRELERRRLLGIDDSDGPSREDLVDALEEVNKGKVPRNRIALQMLAEEMTSWPNLEVEVSKTKGKKKSLYAKATDTGIDPEVAAKKLKVDWDSAAEIEEEDTTNDTEVPKVLGYGALYLVTAFPVIIGISVVLILFYNSLQ